MSSSAVRTLRRLARHERERAARPALEVVKAEPPSWDAVVERLLASWEPVESEGELGLCLAGWPEGRREAFEERAGVLEVDGGFARQEAERRAFEELAVHKVHNGRNGNVTGGAAA